MSNRIRAILPCILALTLLAGCAGNVSNTVLQDFGLQERSADYQSGEDLTLKNMRTVGAIELKRLNTEQQRGETHYVKNGDLNGKFHKEVKRYTKSYPLNARANTRSGNRKMSGFNGTIEYAYEFYEGPRFSNRTKAEASDATVPSGRKGREAYRYTFSASGTWDGAKGKSMTR